MKKTLLSLVLISVTLISCKKEDVTVTFRISDAAHFTIPSDGLINQLLSYVSSDVTTNWEGEFNNHNSRKDQLEELHLENLVLNITSPQNSDFGFLKDIRIYIKADGLAETEIANRFDIPENVGSSMEVFPVNTNIAPYARKDKFFLRIEVTKDRSNSNNLDVRADMDFKVKARVVE